jgi:UDP-glucose:(heptosyl)LPS alpha-1,3-glucosyltransferase
MNTLTCLFVALGSWKRKGIPLLLEAMSILHTQSDYACKLNMLGNPAKGENSLLAPYKRMLEDGTLTLLGYRNNVEPFYKSSDVLLVASYYEACSLVMLEALVFGLPIISTPVNGAEEMVRHGVNGYIVKYDATDMAKHIDHLARNHDLITIMGEESRLLSQQFSLEKIARLTEMQYRAAVHE